MTQRSRVGSSEFDTTQSKQGTTSETIGQVTDQAKETAGQVADQTKQAARHVVDTAREQAASRLGAQKDTAAAGLTSVAQALRQTGDTLRQQDQMGVTSYIDSAASQVEQFSNYLQNSDISQLVDDVERFARRRPALFIGGAFALGILGARFLKSSRQQVAPSTNYPMVRGDMYTRRQGIYDQPYQQPYVSGTTYGTGTATSYGTGTATSYGSETTSYGTASDALPTTKTEDLP